MMIDLIGQSYQLGETNLSCQRTINWYMEQYGNEDKDTKAKSALVPTPGATQVVTVPNTDSANGFRGLYWSSSGPKSTASQPRLYGVWGTRVYRFDNGATIPTQIGFIGNNGQPVRMTDNGFYFTLVDGDNIFYADLQIEDNLLTTGSLVTGTLPYIPGSSTELIKPTHVIFLQQRLIVNNDQGNAFFYSELPSKGTLPTFNDDSFYSAEQNSDPIVAIVKASGTAWIFGWRSYEQWRTGDNALDPMNYVGGSTSALGCKAPNSIATIDDKVFWLGSSDVGADGIYMGVNQTVTRISTMGIDEQVTKCGNRGAAIGYAYSLKGNTFYLLTFQDSNRTFVYETTTNMWHERLLRDPRTAEWLAYPYQGATIVNDDIYVGLLDSPILCKFDDSKYTEYDGRPIVRQRISPIYYNELNNIQLRELSLDCQVGTTGLLAGQGSDPMVLLEVSKDGGYSYGNVKENTIGKQGAYRQAVRWNSLGIGREVVFRLTVSDPVHFSIYQARLIAEPCGRT